MLKFYLFLVGIGTGIDVNLIGRIAVSELLMLFGLPFLIISNHGKILNPTYRKVVICILLYGFGVCIADLYNDSNLLYFSRGIARPIFIAYMTLFLVLAIKREPKCVIYLLLGLFPGAIAGFFDESLLVGEFQVGTYNYFDAKWTPIFVGFSIFACVLLYPYSRILTILGILLPGIIVGMYGSRSATFSFFLSSFTLIYMVFLHGKTRSIVIRKYFPLKVAIFITLSASLLYLMYVNFAPRGYLGAMQQEKFYTQSSTRFGATPWGLIAAGRFDFIVSTLAVIDAPLIGHGSWPQTGEYGVQAASILGNSLSTEDIKAFYLEVGSGHSVLMGSWMNHGLLATIFWLYTIYLAVRVFIYFVRRETQLSAALLLPFFMFTWAFLFSPLNLSVRFYTSLFTALAICFLDKKYPLVYFDQISRKQFHGKEYIPNANGLQNK